MMKIGHFKWVLLGVLAVIGLGIIFAPAYPCSYFEGETYAGWGYHSLADVATNGLEWEEDVLPNKALYHMGDGPYSVQPDAWIILLYLPVFGTLIFFGSELIRNPAFLEGLLPKIYKH